MKNGGTNNLIIDGNNLLYRIFWTNNFKLDEADSPGQIFLFLRSLKSYVDKFQAKKIYCTWDKKLEWPSTNFRNEIITVDYKANRDDDKFKDVHEYSEKIQEIIDLEFVVKPTLVDGKWFEVDTILDLEKAKTIFQ